MDHSYIVLPIRILMSLSTWAELNRAGRRRVTSTSNTRKIMLIRKNFMQKGRRATPEGSNPHSNGDLFS